MTSIERTAYPLLRRLPSARELHVFYTPTSAEVMWARERTRSDEHLLALILALKCFQRLARFPRSDELPDPVVEHVRRCLELDPSVSPAYGADRTARAHRDLVRARLGVIHAPDRARALAETAIRGVAAVKNNPPDLINVALEELIRAGLELPAFSTLDEMASSIRLEVNRAIFEQILARMTAGDRDRLTALLEVVWPDHTSAFNRLKKPAKRATWSHFKKQIAHLRWVDSLGDTDAWFDGIAPSKIADFAGEASAGDAAVLGDYASDKRVALLACLVHMARARARDDVAEMFCKRVAGMTKRAKAELDAIREQQRSITERLIANYRDVLEALDPDASSADARDALALARRSVEAAGGFPGEFADIEAVAAHHGDNHQLLVERFYRKDRAQMFAATATMQLEATSADRSVLDALGHAVAHAHMIRDLIPDHLDGSRVDLSFASENWRNAIFSRKHPGRLVRRHFEACVFTYLAEELRTGDIAVVGSDSYANWAEHLLPWEDCEPLLERFCAEVGLRADAAAFTAALRARLEETAAATDAGYPDNTDLVIDEHGVPTLKRRRGKERTDSAIALEEQIKQRMPERSLLGILAWTAHWLAWWRHFGPASGNDPKLSDPITRYILTTFTYATNLGPYQAARHISGVSAHELGATANRHVTIDKLNNATVDVINAYMQLDLVRAWGDGSTAARPTRTAVSVLAAALSATAFLGLTGASRISQARVSARLDHLRPTSFNLTTNDDSPIVTGRLAGQLKEIRRLSGARGALLIADIQVSGGAPSPHPIASLSTGENPAPVFAVSSEPSAALGAGMRAGREIDAGHVRRGDMVAEVGAQAATDIALPDLRGRPSIFLGALPFEAVGVAGPITNAPDLGTGVFVPYSAAIRAFGAGALQSQRIIVRGTVRALPRLERLAPYVLRPERPASIEVTALGDPVSLRADVASQLTRLVGLVTAGAVLFGAIVVAITFFASVTERRQEFGLRRAVGARTRDIAGFVIGETAVVGFAGGLVGLAVGALGLAAASAANSVGFPVSGVELALAPVMGTAVGLIAGLLPAGAAVRIDPHTALTT